MDFMFTSLRDVALQMGSTLEGKNLLLEEQILSLKNRPLLRKQAEKEKNKIT